MMSTCYFPKLNQISTGTVKNTVCLLQNKIGHVYIGVIFLFMGIPNLILIFRLASQNFIGGLLFKWYQKIMWTTSQFNMAYDFIVNATQPYDSNFFFHYLESWMLQQAQQQLQNQNAERWGPTLILTTRNQPIRKQKTKTRLTTKTYFLLVINRYDQQNPTATSSMGHPSWSRDHLLKLKR